MQHPDEGTIHAWLDDALSGEERAALERHVASCAECSVLVAEARGMIAGSSRIISALDAVPGGVIPKSAPAHSLSLWRLLRVTPARAAIAASLLVAASALVAKRHDTPDKMVPRAPVVAAAPVQAVAPAAPPPTQSPAQSRAQSPAQSAAPTPSPAQPAEVALAQKAVALNTADVNAMAAPSGAVQRNFAARSNARYRTEAACLSSGSK